MNSAFDVAASGMAAAGALLQVGASNIANADSEGYTAKRVDLVELSGGGVIAAAVRDTGQPVDLATEIVGLKRSQLLYGANAAVLRTAEDMVGTLLDVFDDGRDARRE